MIDTFSSGIELMGKGGVMMYPIFLASVVAVAIIIERLVFFKKCKENPDDIFAAIKDLVSNDKKISSKALNESTEGPVSRMLERGVQSRKDPRWKLEEKLTVHGQEEIRELRKNLRGLEVIATISPLMGLLGTVIGMIETFDSLADSALFAQGGGGIAGGISQALFTTQMGLVVAVPGLVMGRLLSRKEDRLATELDQIKDILCSDLKVLGAKDEM